MCLGVKIENPSGNNEKKYVKIMEIDKKQIKTWVKFQKIGFSQKILSTVIRGVLEEFAV